VPMKENSGLSGAFGRFPRFVMTVDGRTDRRRCPYVRSQQKSLRCRVGSIGPIVIHACVVGLQIAVTRPRL
jgi:hypothetical protein